MTVNPLGPASQPQGVNEVAGQINPEQAKLKEACDAFEGIFVNYMLQKMREGIPDGGLFEKDSSSDIYQDMLTQEHSKIISDSKVIGLSDLLYQQLTGTFTVTGSTEGESLDEQQ